MAPVTWVDVAVDDRVDVADVVCDDDAVKVAVVVIDDAAVVDSVDVPVVDNVDD
jgi:hypothetical protein